ncbi:PP2C family protein-serine/threonine phosphatase [Reichenbachiella versicolor]|uniref:PP2C family protein-serine/threonine phosphatase n=1 Tax=Reichenbachiella versicolor TaxID=1821036 RepID=UPI000D6E992B|nr:PP2C family protein-serine/threonine phosphatase [Reichenbachiella versicolor]
MSIQESISSNLKELELNALLEVTEAINNNLPEESLYKIYHFTLLANLKVKKLALYVLGDKWEKKVSFGIKEKDLEKLNLTSFENISGAVNLYNSKAADVFDNVIAVHHKDRLLALVFVGDVSGMRSLDKGKSSTTFLEALTNIILVAIENKKLARKQLEQEAIRKELEIAQEVQQFLFPKELPKTDKLIVDAVYRPHHNVGGDYYDYIPINEDKFMVCIADVSGKGIPAALMMSNFQASLRTLVRQTDDLDKIVRELNYQLYRSGNAEIFITFFIMLYDRNKKSLNYANCGHNPQMLRYKGEIESLSTGTTVLGMFDPLPFLEIGRVDDLSSFCLFCYTDGLTETFDSKNEEFGEERLFNLLNKLKCSDPEYVNKTLLEEAELFRGQEPYRDDLTLLAVKVNE